MKTPRVLIALAAVAFATTPALAQSTAAPRPSAHDRAQLALVERDADKLAAGGVSGDELQTLIDELDQAWTNVSAVYAPFDERANFAGGQAAPYTLMAERISVLNSSLDYGDDAADAQTARAVAARARYLLSETGAP